MEEDAGGVEWFDTWALSLAVFLPLVGALVIAVLPGAGRGEGPLKGAALLFTGLPLLVGIGMLARFDYSAGRTGRPIRTNA